MRAFAPGSSLTTNEKPPVRHRRASFFWAGGQDAGAEAEARTHAALTRNARERDLLLARAAACVRASASAPAS
jgi:hypothetical protein